MSPLERLVELLIGTHSAEGYVNDCLAHMDEHLIDDAFKTELRQRFTKIVEEAHRDARVDFTQNIVDKLTANQVVYLLVCLESGWGVLLRELSRDYERICQPYFTYMSGKMSDIIRDILHERMGDE